ncbi:MAG TPA: aspartate aminotransferase family protein [Trinickia sp.]|uniref:aspartate aminotransferase family protein n=1 Tax=Trinickia sp. TaxID=2571163 RepID=UPI002CA4E234|nr:aspartate aminotransferase family protein [Trinickia sp.]HVW50504.1 aspartate aminotransferase family protein [Trinickia sp.]
MSYVFHRMPKLSLPVAVAGDGIEIIDSSGKRYIDASGGAAVSCLGHSHKRIVDAIERQARRLAYAHTSFFTTEAAEALAEHLVKAAPAGIGYAYFVSGGSEAMEAALKLARQYFVEIGEPARKHFIARRQSYHGNTLGALAIGGNAWRREPFLPLLVETHHVSPCFAYRFRNEGETDEGYAQRLANELEQKILELGPDTVAAFVAETVVGATAGAVPPVAQYFRKIRAVCDKYGVLLILDEVMCGMGRTGFLYACEQEGIAPDLLTIAKGLGAGYQPIGATLVSDRIYDAIVKGSGFFQHGHTYMGHATACAAALEVQRVIEQDKLLANVTARGEQLRSALRERLGDHPHVGDIRGRGLFVGVELVRDRASRAPFDPQLRLHAAIKRQAMERGLMAYPMGGTIDGKNGDHVLLAPPFICTSHDIERIVERLGDAIDAALAGSGTGAWATKRPK